MMAAIFADNLFRRSITSASIKVPGAAMKTMDRDLSDVQYHNCSMFGHYRRDCSNRRKQQYQGGHHQQQPNERQDTRGRQQKKNGDSGENIWCSYHKTATYRGTNCHAPHSQDNENANVVTVQGMCSALDLPKQDKERGRPYIAFSATEVTPTVASGHKEGHVAIWTTAGYHPAPRSWSFVERSTPTISLGKQDKPAGVTHIHGRANKDDVPIYGTALMASESPGAKQKPHGGDNQVTVLVDSEALGNYFSDQRILQLNSPSLDFAEDTLAENYVSSEEILRDVRNCTAALNLNIGIPADRQRWNT